MDHDRDTAHQMGQLLNRFVVGKLPFPELTRALAPLCRTAEGADALDDLLQRWIDVQGLGVSLAEGIRSETLTLAAAPPVETPASRSAPPRNLPGMVEDAVLSSFVDRFKKERSGGNPAAKHDTLGSALSAYEGLRLRRYARETTEGAVRPPLQTKPEAEAQKGMVLRDRFILENELGRGGMGIVYRAIDRRRLEAGARQPYVAIKMLNLSFASHPDALRALEAETRRTQDLADPRITTVYDFDRDGTHAFIVMELLEGVGLDRLLREEPTFCGSEDAQRVLRDLMEALAFTHSRGAIHADLKPGNLFLCADGRLKVLDFGISAVAGQNALEEAPINGLTPSYACPERNEGGPPSASDDVYALGCLVHLLLTGRHPYDRMSGSEAKAAGIAPYELPMLPPAARRAVNAALSFDEAQRPADAGAFLAAFTAEPENRNSLFSFWSARKNG